MPRDHRQFVEAFTREAVQMVLIQQLSFAEVPRRLDLRENMLRSWQDQ
ncbi:transposase [Schlesneria paludicola]|nr:transposase [Schlesneria paludicola]